MAIDLNISLDEVKLKLQELFFQLQLQPLLVFSIHCARGIMIAWAPDMTHLSLLPCLEREIIEQLLSYSFFTLLKYIALNLPEVQSLHWATNSKSFWSRNLQCGNADLLQCQE